MRDADFSGRIGDRPSGRVPDDASGTAPAKVTAVMVSVAVASVVDVLADLLDATEARASDGVGVDLAGPAAVRYESVEIPDDPADGISLAKGQDRWSP